MEAGCRVGQAGYCPSLAVLSVGVGVGVQQDQGCGLQEQTVLGSQAAAFARHDVSIRSVRQEGHGDDASLVLVTHTAEDAALSATVDDLAELDAVRAVASVMRVGGEA